MDLVLKNARLIDGGAGIARDIGVQDGCIVAVEPALSADAETLDLNGRLVVPGFVESHIHLDKSCILDRCRSEQGTLQEALREVAAAKAAFTVEDIHDRAARTLRKCILQGTTRMRTHVEVDPVVGLKGIEAILPLRQAFAWAIDLTICVFPQDGLLNNPGTEELMVQALRDGASVVGGCPYTDSDPHGQIDRIFELARDFDVDIDFHLDFDIDPNGMTVAHVCDNAERFGWGGRVAIGHVSKLSALAPEALASVSTRMADAGVALTVLPSTDLFLMGGKADRNVPRGVAPVHRIREYGVLCALSTNNVLNPFTPFGDCSMIRMANLYANIAQIGTASGHRACLDHVTADAARLMRLDDYGIRPGNPADMVVLDCATGEDAVREIAVPLYGFKNGKRTFTRPTAQLHEP
jgi:cytosine deaminase